jgi:hypothetical protein
MGPVLAIVTAVAEIGIPLFKRLVLPKLVQDSMVEEEEALPESGSGPERKANVVSLFEEILQPLVKRHKLTDADFNELITEVGAIVEDILPAVDPKKAAPLGVPFQQRATWEVQPDGSLLLSMTLAKTLQ